MDIKTFSRKPDIEQNVAEVVLPEDSPDANREKIEKAKALVQDPDYPSKETMRKVAEVIYDRCIKEEREE